METPASTNQTHSDSSSSQDKENLSFVRNSSWEAKSHAEKATYLEGVFTSEKPETTSGAMEIASGTREGEAAQVETHISASKVVPKPRFKTRPTRQASEDYLQIVRAHYLKLILQAVRNVQPHAGTPDASVYIHKILHTIRDFEEKSPDDAILEVLFAFYDALAYDNQWTEYISTQFERVEEILNRITTKGVIKPKDIEKAIAALDDVGFDTIPYQFSLEDDML